MIYCWYNVTTFHLFPAGQLRLTVQRWLSGCGYKDCRANCCINEMKLCKNLYDFPQSFISNHLSMDTSLNFDDGDFSAWEFEANRWARVLFLAITEEHPLEPILMVCFWLFPLYYLYDAHQLPLKIGLLICSTKQREQLLMDCVGFYISFIIYSNRILL